MISNAATENRVNTRCGEHAVIFCVDESVAGNYRALTVFQAVECSR
jgi:hypothetical protein